MLRSPVMTPDPASSRPRRPAPLSLLAVTLAMFAPLAAHAHQYWLAPSRYDAAPGQSVGIGAIAGTGFRGERKPWSPARAVRLVARTSRLVDLAPAASIGEETWVRFAPADPGGAMLAYESNFTSIELPAAAFDAYLAEEGLDGPLATRRAAHATIPGRERYRRCAKAWLFGADETR